MIKCIHPNRFFIWGGEFGHARFYKIKQGFWPKPEKQKRNQKQAIGQTFTQRACVMKRFPFCFKFPKKYISDISFEVNNHELIFSGFFADKKDMEANGAYCIVLEEYSKKVRSSHSLDFDKTFALPFPVPPIEF